MPSAKKKRNPFELVLMAVIVVILVVASVFAFVNYSQYDENIKQELASAKEREMTVSISNVTSSFNTVKSIMKKVCYDWNIIKYNKSGEEDAVVRNDIVKLLRTSANLSPFIHDIAAVFNGHDLYYYFGRRLANKGGVLR